MGDTYTYVSVTRVTPKAGSILGNQAVTITGFGFDFATGGVTFGGTAATNVTVVSNTTITCVTPAHQSGIVDVIVAGVGTGSALYTYEISAIKLPPLPTLSSVAQGTMSPADAAFAKMQLDYQKWLMEVKAILEAVPTLSWGAEQIVGGEPLTRVNDINVTLTLGGTPETALLHATSLTLGWQGALGVARGGTGTFTTFTQGSVVFAGALGVYSQDNANFFWHDTNNRLGLGTTSPSARLHIVGTTADSTADALMVKDSAAANIVTVRNDGRTAWGVSVADISTPTHDAHYWNEVGAINVAVFHRTDVGESRVCLVSSGLPADAPEGIAFPTYTPLTSGTIIGVYGFRGTRNSAGLYNADTGIGLTYTAAENWSDTATGMTASLTSTIIGSTTRYVPFSANSTIGTVISGAVATAGTIALLVQNSTPSILLKVMNDGKVGLGVTPSFDFHLERSASSVVGDVKNTLASGVCQWFVEADGCNIALQAYGTTSVSTIFGLAAADSIWLAGGGAQKLFIGTTGSASGTIVFGHGSDEMARFDVISSGATGWKFGLGVTAPSAVLHIKAGTTAANTAPLKLTSGSLLTTPEAGAIEFLTDDVYATITTGASRKAFVLNDGTALTSGRVPFATTNGRLTDDADFTFATDTLTVTKLVASTSLTVSGLTAGRVVFAGASGLLTDDADLTFATDTLTATKLLAPTSVSTPSLISTGAITITPLSGSSLSVALGTTGDFIVNTTQFVVDTSAAKVGIGTASPSEMLHISGASAFLRIAPTSGNSGGFYFSNASGDAYMATIRTAGSIITGTAAGDLAIRSATNLVFSADAGTTAHASISSTGTVALSGKLGIGQSSPTALLHIKAGTATANTAPLKFTSGTNLTTAEAGAVEFTTDDFYATITTGAARKGILLNDGTNLTSGKIPIATTNGRLIDGQTPLSGTKVYYVADSSGGAVTRKLTFIDGILVSET